MSTGFGGAIVFSGSAHPSLTKEIADFLGIPIGQARLRRFPDSEVSFQIDENIRGADVFIIQPTSNPVDQHLMEMLVMIDAFRRSSAARITAVVPYYGYARQDRKDKPRVPISAKLVANLLSAAGANRVLTMDLHKAQIQGFFDIPVDHLFAAPVIIDYLSRQSYEKLTIGAPDAGGALPQEPALPICTEPWTSLYVLRRGTLPCCYGGPVLAPMASFQEAWNAPLVQDIRRDLRAGKFHSYCFDSPDCPIVRKAAEGEGLTGGQSALLVARRGLSRFRRAASGGLRKIPLLRSR
jgi:hypothetical protein